MSAPAPSQDSESRRFDPDEYQEKLAERLKKLSREQNVTFAARCAWRSWPLAMELVHPEWVARYAADVTAAVTIASGFHDPSFRERYPDVAAADAAYAAADAYAAASAAASAYAAASARKTLQIKIIDYGISLIEEVKA